MTTKTLADLSAGDIAILDGDGVPSPIGQAAPRLQIGTLLAEIRTRLGDLEALPVQTIDMADAQVTLVHEDAGAGEVVLTGRILVVDANSSGTEDLVLPPEDESAGLQLFISNSGGEDILLRNSADAATVATVSTTESAIVSCDGTTWRGGVITVT